MINIDKHKIYEVGNHIFKNYIMLEKNEARNLFNWRNDDRIRKWMFHSDKIPFADHLNFIKLLKKRNDCYYWIVFSEGQIVGSVYIQDVENSYGNFGFYVKPGLKEAGFNLVKTGLNLILKTLNFKSVALSVSDNNLVAFALDVFIGFKYDYKKKITFNGDSRSFVFCKQYTLHDLNKHKALTQSDYSEYMHTLNDRGYFNNSFIDKKIYLKIKNITNSKQ